MTDAEIKKLGQIIVKCNKNHDVPDLHSFIIDTTGGKAFVDCKEHAVEIDVRTSEGERKITATDAICAAVQLDRLGADIHTIEM